MISATAPCSSGTQGGYERASSIPREGYRWASSDRPPDRVGLPPSLLACSSALNIARFCDRGIGRRMEEATNLQLVDPLAAHDLWSSTEHEIVDLAPRVPLLNRSWAVLVSEVLGDYQFNPQWGPLIDQMWVR